MSTSGALPLWRGRLDRLRFDEKVQLVAQGFADAREIVPAFNARPHFCIGGWRDKSPSGSHHRVRIGSSDDAGRNATAGNAKSRKPSFPRAA